MIFRKRMRILTAATLLLGTLAYFDAAGRIKPKGSPRDIATREALKDYDPGLYALVHETMAYEGHVDWRYAAWSPVARR